MNGSTKAEREFVAIHHAWFGFGVPRTTDTCQHKPEYRIYIYIYIYKYLQKIGFGRLRYPFERGLSEVSPS